MTGDYPRNCPIQEILSFLPHLEHFFVHQMLPIGLSEDAVAWDSVCGTLNLLGQGIRHLEFTLSDYAWSLGYQCTDIQHEGDHYSSAPLKHNYKLSANLHDMSNLKSLHLGSELVFLHFHKRDCYGHHGPPQGRYSDSYFVDFLPSSLQYLNFTAIFPHQSNDLAMYLRQLQYLLAHSQLKLIILGNCSMWNSLLEVKRQLTSHDWDMGMFTRGHLAASVHRRIFLTRGFPDDHCDQDAMESKWLRDARVQVHHLDHSHTPITEQQQLRGKRPPANEPPQLHNVSWHDN
jgi:hypothetical protein